MRKVTKTKGAWSNDKGLQKQLYLTLKYSEKSWKKKAFNWIIIQRELMEYFGEGMSNICHKIKPFPSGVCLGYGLRANPRRETQRMAHKGNDTLN